MRRVVVAILSVALASCLPVLAQNLSTDPAKTPSGVYTVNAGHTQVLFSARHLGLTDYFGRFDKISGTLNYDGNQPERSNVDISIDMASIDVPSARLTDNLKNVFGVQQYPAATFKSTSITRTGPDTGQITGMLTMHNVSKSVTLDATFNGGELSAMSGGHVLGFRATTAIKRSDFGLTSMIWSPFVSDDVHLIIEAMFDQQKS
ncbi:MAG TPA: YceI family protein [Rhizomicrobium sp.]|jgi:polyisoprenoid-binding protein YceI|nr:YceI family protein [Rhizomicrobium sp.]